MKKATHPPLGDPRGSSAFPMYDFWSPEYEGEVKRRMERLSHLYDRATQQAWDGHAMLKELIEKHGGINLTPEKRKAMQPLMMSLLWGEMAAWIISLQLAEILPTMEAKLGATSQAFDEARHFFVMRDYCRAAGIEFGGMDPFSLNAVRRSLEMEDLVGKLMCMQILIESVALAVFGQLRRTNVEPVLVDLLKYFERDEARHVALGSTYLPQALSSVGTIRKVRYMGMQARMALDIMLAGVEKRGDFERLGFSLDEVMVTGLKLATKIHKDLVDQMGSGLGFIKPEEMLFRKIIASPVMVVLARQKRMRMRVRGVITRPVRRILRRPDETQQFFRRYSRYTEAVA